MNEVQQIVDDKFVSPNLRMWLDQDILCCKFANNLRLSLDVAKRCVERRIYLSKGRSYPLLLDMKGIKSSSKDARQYLETIGTTLAKADALVIRSNMNRIIGNLLLALDKPRVPTKFFTCEVKAKDWLIQYV